ncbi:MAG TPA: winged helix-turn-helix domain-containing protein [Dokdonella sp.]
MTNAAETSRQPCYRYRFGSADFDEALFELRVAGLREDVERRALEVLACLLRHAGEVVTKEELFAEVWAGRVTVDKVLPNAITKLRRALGEANAQLLQTVPRVGYRLDGVVERVAVGRRLASRLELAAGQPVPARENFVLRRQLGGSGGSEVWLAEHAKTRERRVYKFASDDARLRALKREATLARVLRESLDDHRHFVDLIDWNFETPPYFLECAYGGETLHEWADAHLAAATLDERVAVFLQIVDAVAAAHGVGVLHKDLKPANVLVARDGDAGCVRLTDFGSGRLLDPERLETLGITQFGLTAAQSVIADSASGTPLYVAPEVFSGHAPTAQSDVFALGVLLYQMLAGDLGRPMASGWEQDVPDELLREDVRRATDGDPERRPAGAAALAARLRARDARRERAQRAHAAERRAHEAQAALARSRARRPYAIALAATLAAGFVAVLGLYRAALDARDAARTELDRAAALNRFLDEDLISRSNPLVAAKGADASLKEILLAARGRVAERFAGSAATEASIHARLGTLFNTIELLPEAEAEFRAALSLYETHAGSSSLEALRARADLARALTRTSAFDAAAAEIATLERLTAGAGGDEAKYLLASARSAYDTNTGDYAKALPELEDALRLLANVAPQNLDVRDALRFDLIPVYRITGRTRDAERAAAALIEELKARPQPSALKLAFAAQLLAEPCIDAGEYDRAEALLIDAQKTIVAALGADHSRNLLLLNDLLDLSERRRDWPSALAYAERVHVLMAAKFGADHVMSSVSLGNWGEVLYASGDAGAAEPKLADAYRDLAAKLGASNPQAGHAGFWLAAAEIELGRTDRAEALLESIDGPGLRSLDADGLWASKLDALRGLLLLRRGERDAAASLLQSALDAMERKSATDSVIYAKARRALGAPA